jgi:hypothetical protein
MHSMATHMRKHMVPCLAIVVVGVVLVVALGLNIAIISVIGALFCLAMMGSMVWMMAKGMGGHHHG